MTTEGDGPKGTIGIIAGGGTFPLMVARAARTQGLRVGPWPTRARPIQPFPSVSTPWRGSAWANWGTLFRPFKKMGVDRAVMAGTITKRTDV